MNSPSQSRPQTGASGHSLNPSMSKKNLKKKRQLVPINLEEVFYQISSVTSSNLNPPPGKVVLTPRSAEACLKLGINPEILKIRDIDSFSESGMDPAVQRIRHEAYVQRRYDTMKECRLELKRMTVAEFEASTNMNQEVTMSAEMLFEQQRQQTSSLVRAEMEKIEKMKKRQAKDLEQMISWEVAQAQSVIEMDKRLEITRKKEEKRKKEMEKRAKLVAEERRLKELQKVAMEEAEEQNRVALARQMHEREKSYNEEKQMKEKFDKKRMQQEEEERNKKNAEHRAQVEKFFADEQRELRRKLDSLHDADEKKQRAITEKAERLAEDARVKRAAAEKRIAENMTMAKMIEEKKKSDFLARTDYHERLRNEKSRQEEEERRLRSQELELQEQRRQIILMQMRKGEEKKSEQLLVKFEEEEIHIDEIKQLRDKDHRIHNERKTLRTQMKLENVQRVNRMKEYKRMNTLKKIEDTNVRTGNMIDTRKALVEDRKKAAAETRRQKETIAKVMEEVRTNATKAQKIITQAMSGKVTLESLVGISGGDKNKKKAKKSRSNSASARANGDSTAGESGGQGRSSDQLGLGRHTRSAGGEGELDDDEMRAQQKMYSVQANAPAPKPYVSPYEEGGKEEEYEFDGE